MAGNERELTWEEFGQIDFAGVDIHCVDNQGNGMVGTIERMEVVLVGVAAFVFLVRRKKRWLRSRLEKFVISTFLNTEQPGQFPNGRIKATNPDGSYCIIYCDNDEAALEA